MLSNSVYVPQKNISTVQKPKESLEVVEKGVNWSTDRLIIGFFDGTNEQHQFVMDTAKL